MGGWNVINLPLLENQASWKILEPRNVTEFIAHLLWKKLHVKRGEINSRILFTIFGSFIKLLQMFFLMESMKESFVEEPKLSYE